LEIVNGLLFELAQRIHLERLALNANFECGLIFDRTMSVTVSWIAERELIKLYSRIGSIEQFSVDQYVELLHNCFFWTGTGGANLSVDPENGNVVLVHFLSIHFLNCPLFYTAMESFVNGIAYWQEKAFNRLKGTEPASVGSAEIVSSGAKTGEVAVCIVSENN
jgi:hypothetical protein